MKILLLIVIFLTGVFLGLTSSFHYVGAKVENECRVFIKDNYMVIPDKEEFFSDYLKDIENKTVLDYIKI